MPSLFAKSWHWHRKSMTSEVDPAAVAHDDIQHARISRNNAVINYTPALERPIAGTGNGEPGDTDTKAESDRGGCASESEDSSRSSSAHSSLVAQREESEREQDESEFDDDAVFALTPETCPSPRGAYLPGPEFMPLRVFAGSWNMAARDPFAGRKGQYIGDAGAARELSEFLPLGYDLYVLGTQEKVSKHLHAAVLARLNVAGGSYQRLELSAPENSKSKPFGTFAPASISNNDDEANRSLRASSFGLVGSLSGRTLLAAVSSRSINASDSNRICPVPLCIGIDGDDGLSYLVKEANLRVVAAGAHKFSVTSGSKGGLAVTLQFEGDEQTLTFANCHLDANDASLRRQQLSTLAKELPAAMGLSAPDLASGSDHVVWMGDFNYRIHGLDADQVIELLRSGRHLELHDELDDLADDLAAVPALSRFREPSKWPTFYPTYKKLPDRCPQIRSDPDWPLATYRLRYKEPFYKGGRTKDRVPSWCDRILVSSVDVGGDDDGRRLLVEQKACSCGESGRMERPLRDNYRAINDSLRGSDHSPVACTFVWRVRHPRGMVAGS